MRKNIIKSPVDIPLSCSLFLETALEYFKPFVVQTPKETKEFIGQWNHALLDTIQDSKNTNVLGTLGQRIVTGIQKHDRFLQKCMSTPLTCDMPSWSLHYAIRFTESLRFLKQKQENLSDIKFVDYGCGLSPMAIIAKNEHHIEDAYCIELSPQIIDIYTDAAIKMGVKTPSFVSWNETTDLSKQKQLNTIIGMGVFPYMPIKEQIKQFRVIYENIPNFLIEVKYNLNPSEEIPNSFTLQNLQDIRLTIENVDNLETTMIRNSLRYLSVFRKTLPNERKFIENCRSLFLSR